MTRGFKFLGILEQDFQHDVTHDLPRLGFAYYTFHMVQHGGARTETNMQQRNIQPLTYQQETRAHSN